LCSWLHIAIKYIFILHVFKICGFKNFLMQYVVMFNDKYRLFNIIDENIGLNFYIMIFKIHHYYH
jgi:hypothetical protein